MSGFGAGARLGAGFLAGGFRAGFLRAGAFRAAVRRAGAFLRGAAFFLPPRAARPLPPFLPRAAPLFLAIKYHPVFPQTCGEYTNGGRIYKTWLTPP